ncbi:MAG: hypothetical protein R3290_01405 [Acidimicrobiia bacterium]|nr:hypothetical protein [Acidimicrobiia bacterium]
MEDIQFTDEQHKTWAELYARQLPKIRAHACSEYRRGFDLLEMAPDHIPSLDELNEKITPATGWKVVRTDVRFTDAEEWYRFWDRKEFLITNYMRSWEELDWTPEPDMFHDIFGHLPYFMLPEYAELQEMFAPAFLTADDDEVKENIKRLAWYSTEFGMKREDGKMTVFGTGLMSGGDEFMNAVEGKVDLEEFSLENVLGHDKVMYEQHSNLYVIDGIPELKAELARYFDPILAGETPPA